MSLLEPRSVLLQLSAYGCQIGFLRRIPRQETVQDSRQFVRFSRQFENFVLSVDFGAREQVRATVGSDDSFPSLSITRAGSP